MQQTWLPCLLPAAWQAACTSPWPPQLLLPQRSEFSGTLRIAILGAANEQSLGGRQILARRRVRSLDVPLLLLCPRR